MIIEMLFSVIVMILAGIFSFLPTVSIATIPYIGETVQGYLITIVQTWNAFMVTFPYAETGWNIFLYVIIPFEIMLMIAKFFFGSRLPAHLD